MADAAAAAGGARDRLERLLSRIDRLNPRVNAVVTLDAARARQQADAVDAARARGEAMLPLAGTFATIKDSLETAGLRTTCGAPQWSAHVPLRNADAVQRLVDAGCVVIGKTNVPIYTTDLQSYNLLFGASCNPWDPARSCGGSSGGAAAAVACGLTDFELGSDIGGSIRIPAHFCGIYGHKPSFGEVPFRGHVPPPPGEMAAPDLAVIGPLARSAGELARTLRVLAPALPASPPRPLAAWRVATWFDDADFPLDTAVREVLDAAIDRLAAAGVRFSAERPAPALREVFDNYLRLLWPLTTAHLTPRARQRLIDNGRTHAPDSWHAKLARYADASHRDWLLANEARAQLRARCRDFFSDHHLLLLPVGPVTAIAHDHGDDLMARTISVDGRRRWYWEQMAWISLASAAGLPATVAPAGMARDGLPVGLQIVGPERGDFATIDFAGAIEPVIGGFRVPPGFE
jgi:amidase